MTFAGFPGDPARPIDRHNRFTFANASVVVPAQTTYVAQVGTMSAARSVKLPPAASAVAGSRLVVADESGTVTTALFLAVQVVGNDTFFYGTSAANNITKPGGYIEFASDGVSKWIVISEPGVNGTFGQSMVADNVDITGRVFANPRSGREKALAPTGSYETFPRGGANLTALGAPASGTIILQAIWLPKNLTVTNIVWSFSAASATQTHAWYVLTNNLFAQLRATADRLTVVFPALTNTSIALASPFVTTYDGIHYIGYMVAGTTLPTPSGHASLGFVNSQAPINCTLGLAGQTVPQVDGTNLQTGGATPAAGLWGYVT